MLDAIMPSCFTVIKEYTLWKCLVSVFKSMASDRTTVMFLFGCALAHSVRVIVV